MSSTKNRPLRIFEKNPSCETIRNQKTYRDLVSKSAALLFIRGGNQGIQINSIYREGSYRT